MQVLNKICSCVDGTNDEYKHMKWNAVNVSAACLAVGLGGFVTGKLTSRTSGSSETDKLLERAQQITSYKTTSNRDDVSSRRNIASRTARTTSGRSSATIDERLAKMEEIVRGENTLDRSRSMLAWIDLLAPTEFEAAVAKFRGLGLTEERMGEYAMLLTAWAEVDPVKALTYTIENTRGGMATNTVLKAWASRDPESAIAWAETNHEGEEANPYMVGIISSIVSTDSARATELLQALPFSSERGEALSAMVPHLLKNGQDAAKSWIAGISDERLRDGATARFAEQMAKVDPAATASWLLSNLGEASTRSVDEVFAEWAKTDKTAAESSFMLLPQGAARSRALRGLVTVEARTNPESAAKLMNSHPGDVDDRMVYHFLWNSFDKAPAVAASQIGLIKDEESRNRAYERALGSWLEDDQATAQRWIDSANLPESVLKSLAKRNNP
jgi:hypothetical protein